MNDNARIKYSFTYDGCDYYYIHLGEMRNIPLVSFSTQGHSGYDSTYTATVTETLRNTVSQQVSSSSSEAKQIAESHTNSSTFSWGLKEQITAGFNLFAKAEVSIQAEQNWSDTLSDTYSSSLTITTSLTNTETKAEERALATMEARAFPLPGNYPVGYYRYTMFASSDVYLFVIKNPDKPDHIYYEFKEHMIPGTDRWDLEYTETLPFDKVDSSSFQVDDIVAMVKNLPRPSLDISSPPPPPPPPPPPITPPDLFRTNLLDVRTGEVRITDAGIGSNPMDVIYFHWFTGFDGQPVNINILQQQGYRTCTFYVLMDAKEEDDAWAWVYLYCIPTEQIGKEQWFDHGGSGTEVNYWTEQVNFFNIPMDRFYALSYGYFIIRYDASGGGPDTWYNKNLRIQLEFHK